MLGQLRLDGDETYGTVSGARLPEHYDRRRTAAETDRVIVDDDASIRQALTSPPENPLDLLKHRLIAFSYWKPEISWTFVNTIAQTEKNST